MTQRAGLLERLFRRLEAENRTRQSRGVGLSGGARIALASTLVAVVVLYFATFFASRIAWPPAGYAHPQIESLTAAGTLWEIHYGKEPPRGAYARRAPLPDRAYPPSGYTEGDDVHYRLELERPARLATLEEPLFLHADYVSGAGWEASVNGAFRARGPGRAAMTLPLAAKDWQNGKATIAITIGAEEGPFQGFAHDGTVLLGPASVVGPLTNAYVDKATRWSEWFLIPKLALALLFGFVFLAAPRNREHLHFLLYGFFGAVKLVILQAYAAPTASPALLTQIPNPLFTATVADCVAQLFFFWFLHHFFRRDSAPFRTAMTALALVFCAYVPLALFFIPGPTQAVATSVLAKTLRVSGLFYGILLALPTTLYLLHTRRSMTRLGSSAVLVLFFGVSLTLVGLEMAGRSLGAMQGTVKYVFELLFFVVLAALVALDFGATVRQRDRIARRFKRHVDAGVFEKLMERRRSGGEETDVTALFVDIRGFSAFAETHGSAETFALLNDYYAVIAETIADYGGVLNKFVGDGSLAFWAAPLSSVNHAALAVQAGVELARRIDVLDHKRRQEGRPGLVVGLGLTTGRAMVGEIGSELRSDYTVIGDTVNLAARLQAMTRAFGEQFLITGETRELLGDDVVAEPLGEHAIRGLERRVTLFGVRGTRVPSGSVEWLPKAS